MNGHLLTDRLRRGAREVSLRERILTGPNCSTVQLVVPLKAIHSHWGLKRVVVSTYQSTSGAGLAAMQELQSQILSVLQGVESQPKAFLHQIAFNCIPQIGGFATDSEGYTSEERKIISESRKILDLPYLRITATAVRVRLFLAMVNLQISNVNGRLASKKCEIVYKIFLELSSKTTPKTGFTRWVWLAPKAGLKAAQVGTRFMSGEYEETILSITV